MEGNKLVSEISSLVEEDGIVVLSEIGEVQRDGGATEKQRLLCDLVSDVKEKVEKMMFREEGKTTSTHRATKSDNFEFPKLFINSIDLVQFPSARLL
ncbi:hypothetical protein VNO80_30548 [Phaseolus coccineus]|uniref:Uncharacterized protein n=1 Tax=Phaseolus coccineus TaxID=3886 RepID=A0AAN9QG72_PHACN